ncbi:MAG TPA: amidase family protein [Pseudomonadales bacterium]|nr:amidase family protein [Pseudomonadales bacterium]
MLSFDDYARLDGTALAELIRRRDVSAAEVREVALSAVARFNPKLNAVLDVLTDASAADVAALRSDAPFAGVPFLIKELALHAGGAPCRMGSRLAAGVSFPTDTELMARFRRAGLVTIGTTQTPEFGYCGTTEPVAFGPAHNPWRLGHSPGGSSGGSGAAVGARIVPIAHANDGGGSIRIPASSNGLVGLKPTRDRTPSGPDASDPLFGQAIEFVVTRSVRDAAGMLDAVAGADIGAPSIAPVEAGGFLSQIGRPPERLRVACMSKSPFGAPLHPECAEAMTRTRALLGDLGHEVVDASLAFDFESFTKYVHVIWCVGTAAGIAMVASSTGRKPSLDTLESATLACYEDGLKMTALDVATALHYFNVVSRKIGQYFEGIDVLLSPTSGQPPPKHGVVNQNAPGIDGLTWTRQTFEFFPFTPLFNATGQPAISLPLHWSKDGLPMGSQFVGRFADEATLLRLAAQIEQAEPWSSRMPALIQ